MAGNGLEKFHVRPLLDQRRDGEVAEIVEPEGALEPREL